MNKLVTNKHFNSYRNRPHILKYPKKPQTRKYQSLKNPHRCKKVAFDATISLTESICEATDGILARMQPSAK